MRPAGALAVLACLAPPGAAAAQASLEQIQARYSADYNRCISAPAGKSTLGILRCIAAETRVHDAGLNAAYAKVLGDMTPTERRNLRAAQRAWIAFRDADCAARVDPQQWGSLSRINGSMCILNRTIERTLELETFPPEGG